MAKDCIPRALAQAFYVYGKFVARHPLPFIIIPVIVALGLTAGLVALEATSDAEYLYAPVNGPSKHEREYFRNKFPYNDENYFSSMRLTDIRGFLQIHIQDKNDRNVINDDAIASIIDLDQFLLSHRVKYNGNRYAYDDLCATWQGSCTYSAFVALINDENTTADNLVIRYPFHNMSNGGVLNMIQVLGDPDYDEGLVETARAIQIFYFLKSQDEKDDKKTTAWLDSIRDELLDYSDSKVDIAFQTALSLEQELENSVSSIIPLFVIAYNVLSFFAIFSCMMFDWVRSKPYVALAGMVAAALGIASSLGLMSAAGVKFASVVGTMPFLIIGIGLDDMFILVSAWRYTSFKLSTEERTGEMLKSAAVSITITSVTDALAFGIGCLTPFRSVTIFCAYTGVAICFVYIYMITLTTACMVYSGRREEANRHAFACVKVLPKSEAGQKSKFYQLFCTGGAAKDTNNETGEIETSKPKEPLPSIGGEIEPAKSKEPLPPIGQGKEQQDDPLLEAGIQLPWLNKFLGSTYADFILRLPVKIVIVVVYLGLLSGAIFGVLNLEEGLDRANLAPDDSYFREFFDKYRRDFVGNFGPVVMVSIGKELDYSSESVRDDIDDLVKKFRKNEYFVEDESFVTSWLWNFENYLDMVGTPISSLSTMSEFIEALGGFLNTPGYDYHQLDINFNSDNTSIKSCRFFVQSLELKDSVDELNMMLDARKIADDSKFDVTVFAPGFIFFDQFDVIAINTLQNLGIAVACMMVVSLVLIPSLSTVMWVTVATISICTCIMGYMALWDVSLDSVSMINLVMCIGFSVDFAAHISYHYVISSSQDPDECARDALGYLGTPIIQGALSTVLAVLALSTSDTYIFRTFFKLVFLVMVFGFFHAMFLLPVLLSTFNLKRCKSKTDSNKRGISPKHAPEISLDVGKENNAYTSEPKV